MDIQALNIAKLENTWKKRAFKALSILLLAFAFFLTAYLAILPAYPRIKYKLNPPSEISASIKPQTLAMAKEVTAKYRNNLPESEFSISPNRLIISKIGVNAPIVESGNEKQGLSKGAWRLPDSSTPDKGGNTVITGHRFKYLPPNNLTFYLFDKLSDGDIISVVWEGKDYYYRISKIKIVPATEVSILDQTAKPILTLFTCDPLYSTENRLVVIAEPINE